MSTRSTAQTQPASSAAQPSQRLQKLGLTRVSSNRRAGMTIQPSARALFAAFGPQIRALLAEHSAPAQPPAKHDANPTSRAVPQQIDLPGLERPALRRAFERAGLSQHTTFEAALSQPATRHCLELMAREGD